jgi:hypothetical protein
MDILLEMWFRVRGYSTFFREDAVVDEDALHNKRVLITAVAAPLLILSAMGAAIMIFGPRTAPYTGAFHPKHDLTPHRRKTEVNSSSALPASVVGFKLAANFGGACGRPDNPERKDCKPVNMPEVEASVLEL